MDLYKTKSSFFSKYNNISNDISKNKTKLKYIKQEFSEDKSEIELNDGDDEYLIKSEIEKIDNNDSNDDYNDNKTKKTTLESYIPHSKVGSGRVTMYREFGIRHAYTIEANYYCSKEIHEITSSEDINCSSPIPLSKSAYIKPYSINTMMSMGHGILSAILEMNSNLNNSSYSKSISIIY